MLLISERAGRLIQRGGPKDTEMTTIYMHCETGSVDTREGWIGSYESHELEERGLTAEQAFYADIGKTLHELEEGSREWAVAMVGEENVSSVERENCEPTNRVGGNGLCQNDPFIEEEASVKIIREFVPSFAIDIVPEGAHIRAMYRTSNDIEQMAKDADCSWWDIADIPIYEYIID